MYSEIFEIVGEVCEGCGGTGYIDVGNCEYGVIDECPMCLGEGKV